MKKRKLRSGEREVKLTKWLLDHSAIDTAYSCGVTRQAISAARKEGRRVYLHVKDDDIKYAYELVGERPVWRFVMR